MSFNKILTSDDPKYWSTDYVVESFQIAVPGGDCSIHLLINKNDTDFWTRNIQPNSSNQSLRQLVDANTREGLISAVLVDGGYDGGAKWTGVRAANAIRDALEDLTATYGEIKFTSWVVSHWDRDHYSGSIRMILDDLHVQYTKQKNEANLTDGDAKNRIKSSYFMYDDAGKCLTTLYSPVFDNKTWKRMKKSKWKPKGAHWLLTRNKTHSDLVDFLLLCTGKKPFQDMRRMKFKDVDLAVKLPGICRMCENYENLAGVDFFSVYDEEKMQNWKKGGGGIHERQITFTKLLEELPNPEKPRFLCVGAEGYVLGDNMAQVVHRPSEATLENFISICSLIVWPPTQDPKTDARASYFSGGDSFNNTESKLATWLAGTRVRVIKASHHGARSSTPSAMLESMKPSKFIISAGFEHGHPNWTILSLLYAHYRQEELQEHLVVTLRYPYYLETAGYDITQWKKLKTVDLNMKHKLPVSKLDLLDPTKATKARALDLKTQIAEQYGETYGGLGNFKDWHILDIFAFCNAFKPAEHWDTTKANFLKTYPWKDFNSSANVKLFLYLTMLKEFWGLISSVDERWGPQSLIQPLFIWTRHCDNEDLDGRAQLVRDWAQVFGAQNPTYATIQPNGTFEYKSLMCEGMYENKKGRTKKGQKVDKVSPQQSGEVLRKEPLKKWPKVRAKACMEPDRTTDQNMKTQSRNQVLTRAMTKKAAEKMNIAGEKMNIEEETWGEIVSRKAEFIDSPYKDDSDYEFEEDEDDEDDDDKKDFWVAKPEEREILKKRGGETGLFDGKLLKLTKKMDSTTLEGNSDDNLYDIDMESDSDHDSISGFEPTRARKKFQD